MDIQNPSPGDQNPGDGGAPPTVTPTTPHTGKGPPSAYDPPSTDRIRPSRPPASTPTTPVVVITPPPAIPPSNAAPILPTPVYQQGPSRTDVFTPDPTIPLPVIYGQQRVGAQVWYRKVQPENTEVVLYAICHGPVNSISNITIEGLPITNFATVEIYTGTSGQGLSPLGAAAEPGLWTSHFPYVAYVVAKFGNPSLTHQAPDVMRFSCDVQGLLVRDPRENRFLWSADLSKASWIKSTGLTVAANGTAPDNSVAWNVTDGSATVESEFDQGTFAVANDGTTHRLQFRLLKTTGGTSKTFKTIFSLSGGTGINSNVYINTDTGAVISGSGWTITTDPLNSAWWLCQGALTNNSTGNVTLTVQFFPAAAVNGSSTDDVAQQGTATVGMFQLTRLGSVFPTYAYTGVAAIVGDPTLVTRFYRDNPVLCLADFLSSPTHTDANGNNYAYGDTIADANIDWQNSVITAANGQDTILADNVTKRFTMGLAMVDKKPISDYVETIRQHGQLMRPIYNNGLFQFVMDRAQTSSGIVLTSQGNAANVIAASPLVMKPSSQIPTRVIVNFVNAAANYKNDKVQNDDPGIAGGTVEIVEKTYELGQVSADQATRIARYLRKRASLSLFGVIRVNAEGLQLLPGIRFPLTADQWNVSGADMLISDLNSSSDSAMPSTWDVGVEFYSAATYDDTQATVTAYAPPLGPSPFSSATPADISGMPYRSIMAAQLQVGTLVAPSAAATLGGRVLVGPQTRITQDMATGDTTINVANNNLANNDVVYMETAPGGVQQIEFIKIASAASGTGPYSYTVTRNLNGGGAQAWKQGDAVFDTGQTGNGFIDLYSVRGTKASTEKGPTIVGNVRNSATYNDWTPRWAIGNLDGIYGYSGTTFGVALGVPTGAWVKIDPTNGVRIGFNATTNIQLDAAGNASFVGSITAASGSIGGWTIGATTLTGGSVTLDSSGQITAGNVTIKSNEIDISTSALTFAGGGLNISTSVFATNFSTANCVLDGSSINVLTGLWVGGSKVVSTRGAAVTAPLATIADCQRAINDIISRLGSAAGHGLIT